MGSTFFLSSMGEKFRQVYIQFRIAVTAGTGGWVASWFSKLEKPPLVPRVTNVLY